MQSIKKILVPIDFSDVSEIGISTAMMLGKILEAEIYLIHVVEEKGHHFSIMSEIKHGTTPTIEQLEKAVRKKMNDIREDILKKKGVTLQVYVAHGKVSDEIITFSKNNEIHLIVMGTHGVSGYKEVILGSNAQRVVTHSEIPVLTMQPDSKFEFKKILVPIDNSMHSREKVTKAIGLAKMCNAELHIIGLPDSKESESLDKFKIKLDAVKKIVHSEGIPYISSIEHGDSLASVALNYAAKNNCDLIIINTGHESKITGIFLEAFGQTIVNHSKIPVLSIKHTESTYSIQASGYGLT